jgi:hypothetical protein
LPSDSGLRPSPPTPRSRSAVASDDIYEELFGSQAASGDGREDDSEAHCEWLEPGCEIPDDSEEETRIEDEAASDISNLEDSEEDELERVQRDEDEGFLPKSDEPLVENAGEICAMLRAEAGGEGHGYEVSSLPSNCSDAFAVDDSDGASSVVESPGFEFAGDAEDAEDALGAVGDGEPIAKIGTCPAGKRRKARQRRKPRAAVKTKGESNCHYCTGMVTGAPCVFAGAAQRIGERARRSKAFLRCILCDVGRLRAAMAKRGVRSVVANKLKLYKDNGRQDLVDAALARIPTEYRDGARKRLTRAPRKRADIEARRRVRAAQDSRSNLHKEQSSYRGGAAVATGGAAGQAAAEICNESAAARAGAASAVGEREAAPAPCTAREAYVSEDGGNVQAAGACGAADAAHGAAATLADSARAPASDLTGAPTTGCASEEGASAHTIMLDSLAAACDELERSIYALTDDAPNACLASVHVLAECSEQPACVGGNAAALAAETAARVSS